ncbi:hypothetical protein WR25_04572 [Diploscapter pachys]|uniref:Uncharacterized protein n=1 Tax=Diploscapter pachys TaxID=2018661 RepID=A0A2A2L8F3_9BILA|nr:hypothetical protein WR25_04572 [Diploscapter pachys]
MDDLSGRTVSSEMEDLTGTSENRPDKQSDEELSGCLKGTHWSRLPVEMQIEILKQKNLDNDDKLNLLCAYPELLSVINESYPRENPIAANGGEGIETEPSNIYIEYSSEKKMFYDYIGRKYRIRQPRRIFGLKHDEVMLANLDSKSKHTAILLDALESTSTTTRRLDFNTNATDFQLSLDFAKVLKPSCLQFSFDHKTKEITLNELVEAFPALSELDELLVLGSLHVDSDSLLSYFPKFPPSLYFDNDFSFKGFLHTGNIVKFFRTLVSTKFEERSPAAVALKRIVNWSFQMSYETKTEEGETMRGYKLMSELVADIIPPDSELANQTTDLCEVIDSPAGSTTSDMDEQSVFIIFISLPVNSSSHFRVSTSDSDPDSDMVDSDEGDEFVDDDH